LLKRVWGWVCGEYVTNRLRSYRNKKAQRCITDHRKREVTLGKKWPKGDKGGPDKKAPWTKGRK